MVHGPLIFLGGPPGRIPVRWDAPSKKLVNFGIVCESVDFREDNHSHGAEVFLVIPWRDVWELRRGFTVWEDLVLWWRICSGVVRIERFWDLVEDVLKVLGMSRNWRGFFNRRKIVFSGCVGK